MTETEDDTLKPVRQLLMWGNATVRSPQADDSRSSRGRMSMCAGNTEAGSATTVSGMGL
ncbi:MAG: hypothetical protein ACRYG8_41195 [Janthinobacterium lividum]